MRDPYNVLSISKSATADEVKKAFRRLAKTYHPDQSKDPKAKEKFSEISAAYEILGDEKKRGQFDRGEIDAEGKPRAPQFGGGFGEGRGAGAGAAGFDFGGGSPFGRGRAGAAGGFDASDIFSELFSGGGARTRARPRGEDLATSVSVPLGAVADGTKVQVQVSAGRTLEVKIPAGIEDGQQIRLKGQGEPSPAGGESGDLLITVKFAPHPFFKVEGKDIRLDLPISLYEAALGAKVNIPTLTGKVELTLPPNSNNGKVLRLRGKGLSSSKGAAGDLLVTLRPTLPDAQDAEFESLMRKWQDSKPYQPRKNME